MSGEVCKREWVSKRAKGVKYKERTRTRSLEMGGRRGGWWSTLTLGTSGPSDFFVAFLHPTRGKPPTHYVRNNPSLQCSHCTRGTPYALTLFSEVSPAGVGTYKSGA